MIRKADRKQKSICLFYYPKKEKPNILQKELAKRLKARYDTKTDGYPSLEAEPPTFEQVSPPQQNM